MHGRLKIKTTAEKEAEIKKEKEEKLKKYNELLDKLACKKADSKLDEEALKLTETILMINPDHQTVWNTRKDIVLAMREDRTEEEFVDLCKGEILMTMACLRTNPKSYGSWYHRCWTLLTSPKPDWEAELQLCEKYLKMDERNFHCWDYRRWVVSQASASPQTEFDFTTKMINSNFSNYSAWHNRSKLLPKVHPDPRGMSIMEEKVHLEELELVQNAAFTDPGDSSAWFYLRWLLGQGTPRVPLLCSACCNETGVVCLTFTQPVEASVITSVQGSEGDCAASWSSVPAGKKRTTLWTCRIPPSLLSSSISIVTEDTNRWTLSIEKPVLVNEKAMPLFGSDFSAATSSFLGSELESCEQLSELEPDSKWVMLTMVLLMRALGHRTSETKLLGNLESLARVDPARRGYYMDLKTKFTLEDRIEDLLKEPPETRSASLANQGLTSLYHMEYLACMKNIDLSNNSIEILAHVSKLLSCETLSLDGNQISSTDGLQKIERLNKLSLKDNQISELESLDALRQCPSLKQVTLAGNPVCEHVNFKEWVAEKLSGVEVIV